MRTYNLTRADVGIAEVNELRLAEISTPTQISGHGLIYPMSDGNVYYINASGTKFRLSAISEAGDVLSLVEISSAPTEVSGHGLLYEKTDKNMYFKNADGTEYQLNASSFSAADYFSIGGELPGNYPVLRRCEIDAVSGLIIDSTSGQDIMLNSNEDDSPDQSLIAERIWNSVWNDVADFQPLSPNEEYAPGMCYYDDESGAKICNTRFQKSVIGIASDTFGIVAGAGREHCVPIAVAGWVLAYVDNIYPMGTPLTNDEKGKLTIMERDIVKEFPERLVAIYKKQEVAEVWGPPGKEIDVNFRHWVKVK